MKSKTMRVSILFQRSDRNSCIFCSLVTKKTSSCGYHVRFHSGAQSSTQSRL